jgi:hypothetical protein
MHFPTESFFVLATLSCSLFTSVAAVPTPEEGDLTKREGVCYLLPLNLL